MKTTEINTIEIKNINELNVGDVIVSINIVTGIDKNFVRLVRDFDPTYNSNLKPRPMEIDLLKKHYQKIYVPKVQQLKTRL